ncbi:MAG: acylphosphatase [archaeon]
MRTFKINVKGRVQGVGFRVNTKKFCDKFGLKGFVKNLDDGLVEIVFSGSDKGLNGFVEWLKSNPGLSRVDNVDVEEIDRGGRRDVMNGFEIRRDGGLFRDEKKAIGNLLKRI